MSTPTDTEPTKDERREAYLAWIRKTCAKLDCEPNRRHFFLSQDQWPARKAENVHRFS